MISALWALLACSGMPTSIPDAPGTLADDANLPDVLTVASPDLPYQLWLMMEALRDQDYRTCPEIIPTSTGYSLKADDCKDSGGITWNGSANYQATDTATTITMNRLSVQSVTGPWEAKGTIVKTKSGGYTATLIDTKVALTSLTDPSREMWVDTSSAYTSEGSDYLYADNWSGEIGLADWGTARIAGVRTILAGSASCAYGAHAWGTIVVEGASDTRAEFVFGPVSGVSLAPPPYGQDTNVGGETADTSDSADTSETAETADTTETADTGGSTGTSEDYPCGCAQTAVNGIAGGTCVTPTRGVSWPFVVLPG